MHLKRHKLKTEGRKQARKIKMMISNEQMTKEDKER